MTERTPHPSPVPHGRKPGLPVFAPTECICGGAWPCPWTPKETEEPQTKKRGFAVEIAGLPPIIFLGWRSTHGAVRVAALSKPVSRALVEARATIDDSLRSAAAILRPGDKFDRETGKRIALAKLVEQLVPLTSAYATALSDKAVRVEQTRLKALRSTLFREIWKRMHKGALPARHKPSMLRSLFDAYMTADQKHYRKHAWIDSFVRYQDPKAPVSVDIECARGGGLPLPTTTTPVKS